MARIVNRYLKDRLEIRVTDFQYQQLLNSNIDGFVSRNLMVTYLAMNVAEKEKIS